MKLKPKFAVTEIELVYRLEGKRKTTKKIKSSEDAYKVLLDSWDTNRIGLVEQFKVLILDRAHQIIGLYETSTGGTASAIVDVKLVMVAALKANAHHIILSHNHPSGNLEPSEQDIQVTEKIAGACGLMDIGLLDHIIVSPDAYFSFADEASL